MQSYNEISVVSIPKGAQLFIVIAYLVKLLMILAEMCRKKMEAMNESDSTRTMNGSLSSELSETNDWSKKQVVLTP